MSSDTALPYDGYYVLPKNQVAFDTGNIKKPTILFVHHWGGQRSSSRPYMDFVSSLGFKSASFSQSFHSKKTLRLRSNIFPDVFKGLRYVWAQEIHEMLDAIEGDKIIYSFSHPSTAALKVIGERKAHDIKAWVCDGGPFLELHQCYRNYFTHQIQLDNFAVKEAAVLGSYFLFGAWNLKADLTAAFEGFPQGFPVLNIRGWQDELVPPSAIDAVFKLTDRLQLELLSLPDAGHIDGFKKCKHEYTTRVAQFLNRFS